MNIKELKKLILSILNAKLTRNCFSKQTAFLINHYCLEWTEDYLSRIKELEYLDINYDLYKYKGFKDIFAITKKSGDLYQIQTLKSEKSNLEMLDEDFDFEILGHGDILNFVVSEVENKLLTECDFWNNETLEILKILLNEQ